MCLLVIKVSLKSLQCVCLLSKCLLKASQMRGHLNTCLSTKFPLHTCLDIPSNWNWGNQAQLKQSWSFYSEAVFVNSRCMLHSNLKRDYFSDYFMNSSAAGVMFSNWNCVNLLTTKDAYMRIYASYMRHDPCELSISLWEFIWSIKY